MKIVSAVFLFCLSLALFGEDRIPLLISEHHADHMEFFFRYGYADFNESEKAAMIVLDAHADTVINEEIGLIRNHVGVNISRAVRFTGNHNWIYPIAPCLGTLAWIGTMRGPPHSGKLEGFLKTTAAWNVPIRTVFTSVEELRFIEMAEKKLFISVDLDFFYSGSNGPDDIPLVLDMLFSFSSRWQGPVAWAICLSRPWLPDDGYAWTLLERTLHWLDSRPEFLPPKIVLFTSSIVDTSMMAQAYRAESKEPPALREADTPEHIKTLLQKLADRN